MTPTEVRNLMDKPPLKLSSAAEELAEQQGRRLINWPRDSRSNILWAIQYSGFFYEMACDPLLLAIDLDRQKTEEKLQIERRIQSDLAAAGIINTATAIEWVHSITPSIDRDLAEYKEITDRHQAEIQAFFTAKNATQP